jgi:hypothetical protein
MSNRRHRWATTLLSLVALLGISHALLPSMGVAAQTAAASSHNGESFDGTNYYYSLFRNHLASSTFPDGGSGVGRYGAVGFGAAFDSTGVVFSDMTRGSRVRKITSTGQLYTITGSSSETGCTAGAASSALFGGILSSNYVNAIISASGGYYIADSQCSMLRYINGTTNVTTNIRTFSASQTSRPAALAKTPYANTQQSNIYITDPANNNIRFLTLNTPITAIEGTIQSGGNIFQPIGIALLPDISRIVATNLGLDFIYLDYTTTPASSAAASWSKLSNTTTASPLVTSWDGRSVLYISGNNIMSMPVNTAEANAGMASPSVVFTFTPLSITETGTSDPESMLLFAPRSANSYYILTTHRYVIASATPITPPSSSSGSGSGNDSGSGSGHHSKGSSSGSHHNGSSSGSHHKGSSSGSHHKGSSSSSSHYVTPTPTPTPTLTPTPTPTHKPGWHNSTCDDVCKGAIASSVVMACAGIVLIVLMIIAPANLLTAIIMVPII